MKKIFLFLLITCIAIISGCSNQNASPSTSITVMPSQYKTDNENFKQSIALFREASDLSNPPESENQLSFKLSKETEEKIFSDSEEGIRLGKLVGDDYLDYLHPELKNMFKNKLIKSTEMYYDGLKMNNAGNIVEGAQKQIQGNQLLIEWIDWWTENGESITKQVF